jgi:hypothetical protein
LLDWLADVPRFGARTILCHHIVNGRVFEGTIEKYEGWYMRKLRGAIETTHRTDELGGPLCDRDL